MRNAGARPLHAPLTWSELLIHGLGLLIDTARRAVAAGSAASAAPRTGSCRFGMRHLLVLEQVVYPRLI